MNFRKVDPKRVEKVYLEMMFQVKRVKYINVYLEGKRYLHYFIKVVPIHSKIYISDSTKSQSLYY